jgi:hypothetical protein
MPVGSQGFALRAALEKLRVCYRLRRRYRVYLIGATSQRWRRRGDGQKENGAYGIRTRDLLNAIEALYQLS